MTAAAFFGGVWAAGAARAETPSFEVYGHAQADYVQDFNRVDPNWDDTLRPSKIPTVQGVFGDNGQSIISARQSKFGIKADQEIGGKTLSIKFEFDLFGTGDHEGQTTLHLQHFYGTWGPFLAGQTDSVFMDGGIFPNTIDYWGPPGMVYLRTPQIRFFHKWGGNELAIAIEKPSNDIDPGNIRIIDPGLGSSITGTEQVPDFTAHYRYEGKWGHVQLSGILRQVGFETPGAVDNKPKGNKLGWGVNLTSNVKTWGSDTLHMGVVYGEGIASYMNDGGTDLGPVALIGPQQPIFPPPPPQLEPGLLKLLGLTFYYDHSWSDELTTSFGWSQTKVDNTNFQEPVAFRAGQYASVNVLYTPDPHIVVGAEFLWGQRQDHDHETGLDNRLQISFRYTFTSKDFIK